MHRGCRPGREGQRGDGREAATAAATQGPEQVGLVPGVDVPQDPVGGDQLDGTDRIAGQAERPGEDADPTAEGEAGDPDGRAGAGGDRCTTAAERLVDLGQSCAGADPDGTGRGVHVHR